MKHRMTVCLTLLIISFSSFAAEFPKVIAQECTTNEKIFHTSEIRTTINSKELKREAMLLALGASSSSPTFSTDNFIGQWFYEYEIDDVIFAGFKVRSHYLKIAIVINLDSISTVVCDSKNLKQREGSIHRKTPSWKDQFDSKARIELGIMARNNVGQIKKSSVKSLESLMSKGVITDEEFDVIKTRIENMP